MKNNPPTTTSKSGTSLPIVKTLVTSAAMRIPTRFIAARAAMTKVTVSPRPNPVAAAGRKYAR